MLLRAAVAGLVAALLWWRGHHVPAAVLVALAVTLTIASARFPAVARRVERVEGAIQRVAGRVLAVVLIGAVHLLVFTPISAVLRLLRHDPLALGQSRSDASFWRPVVKRRGRPLYRRPFSYDRIPGGAAGRGVRVGAALGLILVVVLLDVGLGALLNGLKGDDATARQASGEVNLLTAPDVPAGRDEPWRADLGREIAGAWGRKRYDPFLGWRMTDFHGRYVNQENGVRRSYQAPGADDPNAVTVYFLGGSTMFGAFQRDEHTIPSEFARLAEADGMPVRVVNYGQLAYVNWQEVLLLESLIGQSSRPDLAVFYDGYNELLSQFALGHHRRPTTLDAREIADRLRLGAEPADPSVWTALYDAWRDTSAVHRVGRSLGLVSNEDTALQTPWTAEQGDRPGQRGADAALVYGHGVDIARRLADSYGFRSAFFWQPSVYSKRVVPGEEQALLWLGADAKAWREATRVARSRLEPPAIDVSDALDGESGPVMYDSAHTNERGARAIARAMYARLRPQLRELNR
jgi:hypothetical protein